MLKFGLSIHVIGYWQEEIFGSFKNYNIFHPNIKVVFLFTCKTYRKYRRAQKVNMPNSHNSHHSDFLGLNVKCFLQSDYS